MREVLKIALIAIAVLLGLYFLLRVIGFVGGALLWIILLPVHLVVGLVFGLFGLLVGLIGLVLAAVAFVWLVCWCLGKTGKERHGSFEEDEGSVMEDVHAGVTRLKKRVETLETLITERKG